MTHHYCCGYSGTTGGGVGKGRGCRGAGNVRNCQAEVKGRLLLHAHTHTLALSVQQDVTLLFYFR